jgi:hypothetical protein
VKIPAFCIALLLLGGRAAAYAGDLSENYQELQQAVAKKDAAEVKKLVAEMKPMIAEAICIPAPEAAEEKAAWNSQMEWTKSVQTYSEYALYATAIVSPAETTVDLIATLEEYNPKSKYLDQAYGPYMVALNQTGAAAKVPAVAEKALVNFPNNEDLLLVLADNAITRKQVDRALTYATRLTAALSKRPKPEGVSAADWERKRNSALGRGYWIAGVISGERNQYAAADKNLRAALPLISGDAMTGPALFYLGVANFNIGKMTNNKAKVVEAGKFSDQAATIAGPYQEQAWRNAGIIKKEAAAMR